MQTTNAPLAVPTTYATQTVQLQVMYKTCQLKSPQRSNLYTCLQYLNDNISWYFFSKQIYEQVFQRCHASAFSEMNSKYQMYSLQTFSKYLHSHREPPMEKNLHYTHIQF